jgi:hypothetical protein
MDQKTTLKTAVSAAIAVTVIAVIVYFFVVLAAPASRTGQTDKPQLSQQSNAINANSASNQDPGSANTSAPANTATDGETRDPPVDPGSHLTDPVQPDDPKDPDRRLVLKYGPTPQTNWDADGETYRARAVDDSLSREVRADAQTKLNFRFAEWRGRNSGRLGGFEFRASELGLLDGWDEVKAEDMSTQVRAYQEPVYVERLVGMKRGQASLFLRIRVAVSVGWAHQVLLSTQTGSGGGDPLSRWGDLHDIQIGDVWFGDKALAEQGAAKTGAFSFARRNVVLYVEFNGGESTYTLDLMRLARELDAQIQEQGLPRREWSDIAKFCPNITQFEVDEYKLPAKGGTRTPIRHQVAADPGGSATELLTATEGAVSLNITYKKPYAEVGYFEPDSIGDKPFATRCWLVAVNTRSLLFSVAELTFTLEKP